MDRYRLVDNLPWQQAPHHLRSLHHYRAVNLQLGLCSGSAAIHWAERAVTFIELKIVDVDSVVDDSARAESPRSSGLDTGVEEAIDVDDVLEEAPLGLGAGLSLNVVLDGGLHLGLLAGLHLDGLGVSGEDNSSDGDFLEHFEAIKNYKSK